MKSLLRGSAIGCAILLLLLLKAPSSRAVDITEVVSASPSWDTFTNRDGTGLYHEILREVFALYGVTVRHEYSKSGRAEELVAKNLVDMMTCDTEVLPPLVMGRYPMYANNYYVFFNKDRIGPWQGVESLRDREVIGQPTYYSDKDFPVPVKLRETLTGSQALGMIILGRSDFYVDDMTLINQSIAENTIPFVRQEFDIKKVGQRSYHPLFNTTERGRAIVKMYDDGMQALHRQGKLRPIYDKWGHTYPDFDDF